MEDGGAARAGVGGVSRLGDEVLDNVVEGAEVVGVGLAQLQEVERRSRAQGGVEINLRGSDGVSKGPKGLEGGVCTIISPNEVSKSTDWSRDNASC